MKLVNLKRLPLEDVSHNPEVKKQVMVKNGEIPKLTGFSKAVFRPGQKCEEHRHETMYEVYLVLEGEAKLRVNAKEFRVGKNDCIIIKPKELHSVGNDSEQDLVWVYFGIAIE